MFTGIITDIGDIIEKKSTEQGLSLRIAKPSEWKDLQLGESIAVNGVCLTVASIDEDSFSCELMPESLQKTTFGQQVPQRVNLERSLKLNDRLGGHFVQGHVDAVGAVEAVDEADGYRLKVQFDARYRELLVAKGSITIDGVALTVSDLAEGWLKVALVPYTLEHTTLVSLRSGDKVNLEFDVLGKYVINSMKAGDDGSTSQASDL